MEPRIALIGLRGVGKSSVGKLLSFYLNYDYVSTDVLCSYEMKEGSISEYINNHSWLSFRSLEKKVLEKAQKMSHLVLDTGGGILVDIKSEYEILSQDKINLLKHNSYLIYLFAKIDWLLAQEKSINSNKKDIEQRPDLLQSQSIKKIYEKRDTWYRDIADYSFDRTMLDSSYSAFQLYNHIKGMSN